MKLGKQPALYRKDTKKLKLLLSNSKIDIPDNINWYDDAQWPMWLNDKLGCCTQVSVASAIKLWTYVNSSEINLTDDNIVKNYSDQSGYNPNISGSDNGAVEVDVIRRWINIGYITPTGTSKLLDFGYINPRNTNNIKSSICLFGGIYIGISIPNYAMSRYGVWELESTDNNIIGGHAIYVHGYDKDYLYFNTWGSKWKMSWNFFEKYCDESYGLISQEWLSNNTSPFYESLTDLKDELSKLD